MLSNGFQHNTILYGNRDNDGLVTYVIRYSREPRDRYDEVGGGATRRIFKRKTGDGYSLESAGDGGLIMVTGLSGSLGDGDGSRLVMMVPFVKCCIGCTATGGGGERRPLTPGINGPP